MKTRLKFMKNYLLYFTGFVVLNIFVYNVMLDSSADGKISGIQPTNHQRKYVIYQCLTNDMCGGWADRLKGMMAAYVWSLLTNRTFVANVHKHCPLKGIFESVKIPWYDNVEMVAAKLQSNELTSAKLYKINEIGFWEQIRQMNPAEYEKDKDVIVIQNNIDWVQPLSENINLIERIREIGFDKSQFQPFKIFKKFYGDMFRFTPKLEAIYADYLNRIGSSTLICLQLRTLYNEWHMTDSNMEKIINFTKEVLVPMAGRDYKILITSDLLDREIRAMETLKSHNSFRIDGTIMNIDLSVDDALSKFSLKTMTDFDCASFEKTFLDFHMFQKCKIALIGQSGFGKYGLWNRDEPFENFYAYIHREDRILKIMDYNHSRKYFEYQ
jgi:hypothetical protein